MTNYQHIAEQMYAAYCQQAGGLTFDGKPLPSFSGIGLERQTCWKAAAEAAHKQYAQPQEDALDAERWRFIKRKLYLTGNGDGTCAMQALNLPARILGWPDVGELAIAQFLDAAIDAAIAAQQRRINNERKSRLCTDRPCVQPANLNIGLAMTDRELLELAAKAAGILTPSWYGNASYIDGMLSIWNPLEDEGDALRLAVELRLVSHIWDDGELASAAKTMPDGRDPPSEDGSLWSSADAHASGGLAAATRRAIVRAAAEIGAAANK